nr:hypothetical protein [Escherichia coli]
MALPFAADACLVASSFEADADDADDAAELADDAAAALEEAALSAEVFAFVSEVFAAEADSLLQWLAQWLCQPSLWLLKRMMRRFLPIFRRRWHWLRPARHLLTRHWQIMQPLFLNLPQ